MIKATLQSLYPRKRGPLLILQEYWWVPGAVATGVENLILTGTRTAELLDPERFAIPTPLSQIRAHHVSTVLPVALWPWGRLSL